MDNSWTFMLKTRTWTFVLKVSILCNENWSKFNTSKTTNLERKNRFEASMLHFGFVNAPLTDRKCTTYES